MLKSCQFYFFVYIKEICDTLIKFASHGPCSKLLNGNRFIRYTLYHGSFEHWSGNIYQHLPYHIQEYQGYLSMNNKVGKFYIIHRISTSQL